MAGIWVLSEQPSTLYELTGEGRKIADLLGVKLTAVAFNARESGVEAITYGADQALLITVPEGQPLETAAATLADLAKEADPDVILIGATLRAKDLAARIAARLGTGLSTDATNLRVEGAQLLIDRMVYGGVGVATQSVTSRPQMATVPPRTFGKPEQQPRIGEVREVAVPADSRVSVVERRAKSAEGVDIAEAPVVVAVGRGLQSQADLGMIEELAATLGGAVGCTRPVAEDLGWLPEDRYIGISGRKVAPTVYICVAASGQVQHIAGMRDSKVVVAINKDENAPIFKQADYGLVGDAYQAVPALTAALKGLLG